LKEATSAAQRSIEKTRATGIVIASEIETLYSILQSKLAKAQNNSNNVFEYLKTRDELLLSLEDSLRSPPYVQEAISHVSKALILVHRCPEISEARWKKQANGLAIVYRLLLSGLGFEQSTQESEMDLIWNLLSSRQRVLFLEDMELAWKCIAALKEAKTALLAFESSIQTLRNMSYEAGIRNGKMASCININESIALADYYLSKLSTYVSISTKA